MQKERRNEFLNDKTKNRIFSSDGPNQITFSHFVTKSNLADVQQVGGVRISGDLPLRSDHILSSFPTSLQADVLLQEREGDQFSDSVFNPGYSKSVRWTVHSSVRQQVNLS